ncbi:unnamed protein product, partial [Polarella glacialis]
MEGASWVLRSPHEIGSHLVLRSFFGREETIGRLVSWASPGSLSIEVVDATVLPGGIRAVSWSSHDSSAPLRLAACSAEELMILDLQHRSHPRRVRATYKPTGSGELGAGVAWVSAGLAAIAKGNHLQALDAETGARLWAFSGAAASGTGGPVTSLSAVGERLLAAGWEAKGGTSGSGVLRFFDLRASAGGSVAGAALAVATNAVFNICACPLEPLLLASHPSTDASAAEAADAIHIWDLRRCAASRGNYAASSGAAPAPQPVARLHAGRGSLSLPGGGGSQAPVGLEWSPAKRGTLLVALSGAVGVQCCRLWEMQGEGAAGAPSTSPEATGWCGEAQTMTIRSSEAQTMTRQTSNSRGGGGLGGSGGDLVVAAGWAHGAFPGALRLEPPRRRRGGLLGAPNQVASQWTSALDDRGTGGASVSPNGPQVLHASGRVASKELGAGGAGAAPKKVVSSAPGVEGVPARMEFSSRLAESDPCYWMRFRAERYGYGVQRLGYDGYSAAVRAAPGLPPAATEALAEVWQWVKLADGAVCADGAPQLWKGAQAPLNLSEDAPADEEVTEPARGLRAYASPGRRRALQLLGFPEVEREVTRALGEQFPAEREADDAVRRVLRSVLWLQFERAAAECEQLEAHCGPPAKLLLPQLVLLFHSASYLLLAAGGRTMAKEGEEDIVRRSSGIPKNH